MIRAAVLALLLVPACTRSQSDLVRDDRPVLEAIVASDVRASRAMADADAASADANRAAAIVRTEARPALEAAKITLRTEPRSAWGKEQHARFARLLERREAALDPYVAALESKDPEKLLAVAMAQADIEREALAAVAVVREQR